MSKERRAVAVQKGEADFSELLSDLGAAQLSVRIAREVAEELPEGPMRVGALMVAERFELRKESAKLDATRFSWRYMVQYDAEALKAGFEPVSFERIGDRWHIIIQRESIKTDEPATEGGA